MMSLWHVGVWCAHTYDFSIRIRLANLCVFLSVAAER